MTILPQEVRENLDLDVDNELVREHVGKALQAEGTAGGAALRRKLALHV